MQLSLPKGQRYIAVSLAASQRKSLAHSKRKRDLGKMKKLQTTPQYVSRSQNVSFLFLCLSIFMTLKDKISKKFSSDLHQWGLTMKPTILPTILYRFFQHFFNFFFGGGLFLWGLFLTKNKKKRNLEFTQKSKWNW